MTHNISLILTDFLLPSITLLALTAMTSSHMLQIDKSLSATPTLDILNSLSIAADRKNGKVHTKMVTTGYQELVESYKFDK